MNVKTVQARVEATSSLTDSILQLILEPKHYLDYQAGQYLKVLVGGEEISYSIANAPLGSHKYELHIRHSGDNTLQQLLFADIKKHGSISIKLPYGECGIDSLDSSRPIIFIAGGTGFAPVNAMIEQLLANSDPRPMELFWGARSKSDLYLSEKVDKWQNHVSHFTFFSFLSDGNKDAIMSALLARHKDDLADWQIVLSGPFDMVYQARDILVDHGVPRAQLFSDAFSFEAK